jgi:hypothetical protein
LSVGACLARELAPGLCILFMLYTGQSVGCVKHTKIYRDKLSKVMVRFTHPTKTHGLELYLLHKAKDHATVSRIQNSFTIISPRSNVSPGFTMKSLSINLPDLSKATLSR